VTCWHPQSKARAEVRVFARLSAREGIAIYAIIKTGGKQYRVHPGEVIEVERLEGEPGASLEIGEVLMVVDGDSVTVGTPNVAGAKVVATVVEETRAPKVIVFKYKPKIRYRRTRGHKQRLTRLRIESITA
jgi:large subunit ribosomal protein L21